MLQIEVKFVYNYCLHPLHQQESVVKAGFLYKPPVHRMKPYIIRWFEVNLKGSCVKLVEVLTVTTRGQHMTVTLAHYIVFVAHDLDSQMNM